MCPASSTEGPLVEQADAAFDALDAWLERRRWRSHDVCDVRAHPVFLRSRSWARRGRAWSLALAPLNHLERRRKPIVRMALRIPRRAYAQAHALGARAYFARWAATGVATWREKGARHLRWLEANPAPGFDHLCWGQPYDWPSRQVIPSGTPRTTVTSIAVQAFLDGYEATGEASFLAAAEDACRFFVSALHRTLDADGDICFAYTTVDEFKVHNANMVGAAALLRTGVLVGNDEYEELARSAARFTVKEQNRDGSWFYWSPQDPPSAIDHYHTGFVLEALSDMAVTLADHFPHGDALARGTRFYVDHLFDPDGAPRHTPTSRYPIDIQSCAQAAITFAALARQDGSYAAQGWQAVAWALTYMFDPRGFFYYRRLATTVDRTPYVRWGQSWMLRALAGILATPAAPPEREAHA